MISIPTNEADVLCDEGVVTNSFQNPGGVQLDFRSLQDFATLQSKCDTAEFVDGFDRGRLA